jgi:hypothetical protein
MLTQNYADEKVSVGGVALWLMGGILLAVGLRLWIFNGLFGHDDWVYLFYVRSHLNGDNQELLQVLWGLRWGVWVPVATLFQLFGVHYELAFLPGFLMGLACIPLAYAAAWQVTGKESAARWASIAMVLNPVDWFVSSTLRGDIEMSFYGGILIWGLLLLGGRDARSRLSTVVMGLGIGLVWGMAALTKEWAFVFGWGFVGVAIVRTWVDRRIPWSYGWILLGLVLVLSADAWLLHGLTGNFWQRISRSLSFYDRIGREGAYEDDLSVSAAYLPSLLLNLPNRFQSYQRFVNGYPLLGWYYYAFFGAAVSGIWAWRNRPLMLQWVSAFVVGILLWIQWGSMSLTTYLPYHKEPRYLTVLSVPIAVVIGVVAAQWWRSGRWPARGVLLGLLGGLTISTTLILRSEHAEYVGERDVVPALIRWLELHPQANVWTKATLQQEIDLKLGYRFSDPLHGHQGVAGFGSVQDFSFLENALPGDYVLVSVGSDGILGERYTPERWTEVARFPCKMEDAVMYQLPYLAARPVSEP